MSFYYFMSLQTFVILTGKDVSDVYFGVGYIFQHWEVHIASVACKMIKTLSFNLANTDSSKS